MFAHNLRLIRAGKPSKTDPFGLEGLGQIMDLIENSTLMGDYFRFANNIRPIDYTTESVRRGDDWLHICQVAWLRQSSSKEFTLHWRSRPSLAGSPV